MRYALALALVLAIGVAGWLADIEVAYVPGESELLNPGRINQQIAYNWWGRAVGHGGEPRRPEQGAVAIDEDFLRTGRHSFYAETFGNEEFSTDIAGLFEGPLSRWTFMRAVLEARREGTSDLKVRAARTVTIGGMAIEEGRLISTGLDLAKGAWLPIGMTLRFTRWRVQGGITCAACHSAWDPASGRVVEGVPNRDIRIGPIMAMASNTAAFFSNGELASLDAFLTERSATIRTADGGKARLPDPTLLEEHMDRFFMSWPPGSFDPTADLVSNPTQIPDSFTWQDHPYGWTGFAAVGPFNGLSVLNNNVHALNSDGLSHVEGARAIFGFDKEIAYGMILQNAASRRYRFDARNETRRPSEFFGTVDPTPMAPGVNSMVRTPTFPKGSLISPDGMFISLPGHPVWHHNNAISAFQNTLAPPPAEADAPRMARGRAVFERAKCAACHSGPGFTNHSLIPLAEIRTSPSRAGALANLEPIMAFPPLTWSWDTPVPLPNNARWLQVPTDHLPADYLALAYAFGGSPGGYKVKGLIGLAWSAPYLHDGGVAVGPDAQTDLGIPGTLLRDILPDPANSLRALLDRELRKPVLAANRSSPVMQRVKVTGEGHEYWADAASGFSAGEQAALIYYLLNLGFDRP